MMHEPQSHTFDPNSILQRVWQSDYPNSWRVFFGSETFVRKSGLYIFFLILLTLGFVFSVFIVVIVLIAAIRSGGFADDAVSLLTTFLFVIAFLGVLIFLTIRGLDKEIRKESQQSQQPAPTMVVMLDGVVAYHRQQIRSLVFAEIAHMQLRVQPNTQIVTTYTTTTTYDGTIIRTPSTSAVSTPYIWLDLILYGGRRDNWAIDIASQEIIAQSILDAYHAYHQAAEEPHNQQADQKPLFKQQERPHTSYDA